MTKFNSLKIMSARNPTQLLLLVTLLISQLEASSVTFTLARKETKCFKDDFAKGQVRFINYALVMNSSNVDIGLVL